MEIRIIKKNLLQIIEIFPIIQLEIERVKCCITNYGHAFLGSLLPPYLTLSDVYCISVLPLASGCAPEESTLPPLTLSQFFSFQKWHIFRTTSMVNFLWRRGILMPNHARTTVQGWTFTKKEMETFPFANKLTSSSVNDA